ncbi:hypothetical protein AJ80_01084 [Polytolypa hystricis UAMH7299]|uniref:Ubiquitin-like protease family profile domain-containing protein n=1 Tax=Polytolypa hystricis (strain UAMH7299) TaxID=1447883 RepID=A0A2B7Z1X6_POLH7|nr:hypothetical protein AJ80_01084 [Polytolypa hystricis UAMH7299]
MTFLDGVKKYLPSATFLKRRATTEEIQSSPQDGQAHGVRPASPPVPMPGMTGSASSPTPKPSGFGSSSLQENPFRPYVFQLPPRAENDPSRYPPHRKSLFARRAKLTDYELCRPKRESVRSCDRDNEEENRLLGSTKRANDRDAVLIRPGITSTQTQAVGTKPSVKELGQFKPYNTLSRNPKSKHPDWKSAAPGHTTHAHHPSLRSNGVHQQAINVTDENSGHPRKKRKTNSPPAEYINLVEEDDPASVTAVSPLAAHVPMNRRASSQGSGSVSQTPRPKPSELRTLEFWGVEEETRIRNKTWVGSMRDVLGPEEDPEAFTQDSKKDRVKERRLEAARRAEKEVPGGIMQAVQIPALGSTTKLSGEDVRLSRTFMPTGGQPRNFDQPPIFDRESSDELQGPKTVPDCQSTGVRGDRGVSPSNIRNTNFSLKTKPKRPRSIRPKGKEQIRSFSIDFFQGGSTTSGHGQVVVDLSERIFRLEDFILSLDKIVRIDRESDPGTKMRLQNRNGVNDYVYLQFATEKGSNDFCHAVSKSLGGHVNVADRASTFMNNVFATICENLPGGQQLAKQKREVAEVPIVRDDRVVTESKRRRLVEKLQDHNQQDNTDSTSTSLRRPNRGQNVPSRDTEERTQPSLSRVEPALSHSHPSVEVEEPAIPIPVKTVKTTYNLRETRSRTQQLPTTIYSDRESSTSLSPVRENAQRWPKPLLYPPTGKKRAEVEFHDLDRLRDNEFLNDNLIGFYLRFLEHHLERNRPGISRRVYFFNSYFFASLTNSPKGRRGINYAAVEKWTRTVNIFSYDYIVVPINENAHWYMAVICNLPTFWEDKDEEPTGSEADGNAANEDSPKEADDGSGCDLTTPTGDENNDTPRAPSSELVEESGKDKFLQESLHSMSLSDDAGEISQANDGSRAAEADHIDKDEWPDEEENVRGREAGIRPKSAPSEPLEVECTSAPSHTAKFGRQRPSKKRNRKYDLKQPCIITFDSLGIQRHPVARILRDYLQEEAKAKQSRRIDAKPIKGITAKAIPLQSNYSDCGLYLLAYMEKFTQDPELFIGKLLAGEMDEEHDWPNLKSRALRRRLRNFLDDLYIEQQNAETKLIDKTLLVDTVPLEILLADQPGHTRKPEPAPHTPTRDVQRSEDVRSPSLSAVGERPRLATPGKSEPPRTPQTTRSSPRLTRRSHQSSPRVPVEIKHDASYSLPPHKFMRSLQDYVNEEQAKEAAASPRRITPENVIEVPGTPE